MPRNPNVSYENIAHFLSATNKPATINDIAAAGIVSRSTAYRLLVDEHAKKDGIVDVPIAAKTYGIFPVGRTYPTHYVYRSPGTVAEILDPAIADQWKKLNRVAGSLSDIVADMPPIDYLDKLVITAFQKHRLAYRNDATLKENFIKPPVSVDMYLELLDNQQLRKQLIDDPNKFRTLILSMFVSSYNESDDFDE